MFWLYLELTCGIVLIGLTTLLKTINVSKRKISVITAMFLVLFMLVTGSTPSVVRAVIMAELVILSRTCSQESQYGK